MCVLSLQFAEDGDLFMPVDPLAMSVEALQGFVKSCA